MVALGAAALVIGPLAPAYAVPVVSSHDGEPVGVSTEAPVAEHTSEPAPTPEPTAEPTE